MPVLTGEGGRSCFQNPQKRILEASRHSAHAGQNAASTTSRANHYLLSKRDPAVGGVPCQRRRPGTAGLIPPGGSHSRTRSLVPETPLPASDRLRPLRGRRLGLIAHVSQPHLNLRGKVQVLGFDTGRPRVPPGGRWGSPACGRETRTASRWSA